MIILKHFEIISAVNPGYPKGMVPNNIRLSGNFYGNFRITGILQEFSNRWEAYGKKLFDKRLDCNLEHYCNKKKSGNVFKAP